MSASELGLQMALTLIQESITFITTLLQEIKIQYDCEKINWCFFFFFNCISVACNSKIVRPMHGFP